MTISSISTVGHSLSLKRKRELNPSKQCLKKRRSESVEARIERLAEKLQDNLWTNNPETFKKTLAKLPFDRLSVLIPSLYEDLGKNVECTFATKARIDFVRLINEVYPTFIDIFDQNELNRNDLCLSTESLEQMLFFLQNENTLRMECRLISFYDGDVNYLDNGFGLLRKKSKEDFPLLAPFFKELQTKNRFSLLGKTLLENLDGNIYEHYFSVFFEKREDLWHIFYSDGYQGHAKELSILFKHFLPNAQFYRFEFRRQLDGYSCAPLALLDLINISQHPDFFDTIFARKIRIFEKEYFYHLLSAQDTPPYLMEVSQNRLILKEYLRSSPLDVTSFYKLKGHLSNNKCPFTGRYTYLTGQAALYQKTLIQHFFSSQNQNGSFN